MNTYLEKIQDLLTAPTRIEFSVTRMGVKETFQDYETAEGYCYIHDVDLCDIAVKFIQTK